MKAHSHARGSKTAPAVFAAALAGLMIAPAQAQDTGQGERALGAREARLPSGPFGAFAELNYGAVQQDDSVAYPSSNDVIGATFGVLVALPDVAGVMIPSVVVERSSGDGANPFATTEATGTVVGGDLAMAVSVAPNLRLHLGAGLGGGEQEVVFNGADVSVTDLSRYSARVGLSADIYADDDFTLGLSNMIDFVKLHADYAPTNSVDSSSSTILANNFTLTGTWDVTERTRLDASATFVHLLIADPMAGDNALDENYGLVSLGATHDVNEHFSVYGSAGVVIGGIRQGSTTARLGVTTYF